MLEKTIGTAILLGMMFSSIVYSQECAPLVLYNASGSAPRFEGNFPEAPEWYANWGEKGFLKPPYIRLSGEKEKSETWEGSFFFENLPARVAGGKLELDVYSSKEISVEISLGVQGKSFQQKLSKNTAQKIQIPIEMLLLKSPSLLSQIKIALKNVPAKERIDFFLNGIQLSCAEKESSIIQNPVEGESLLASFEISNTSFEKPFRKLSEKAKAPNYPINAFEEKEKDSLRAISPTGIFVKEEAEAFLHPDSEKVSLKDFAGNLYRLSRGFLMDSLFSNPKTILQTAKNLSAAYDYRLIPIILADIAYNVEECAALGRDSLCAESSVSNGRYFAIALGNETVSGSKIRLVFDPYFWVTNEAGEDFFLTLECGGKIYRFEQAGTLEMELPQLGVHTVKATLRRGDRYTEQILVLEAK